MNDADRTAMLEELRSEAADLRDWARSLREEAVLLRRSHRRECEALVRVFAEVRNTLELSMRTERT